MRTALLVLVVAACSKDAAPGPGSSAPAVATAGSAAKKGNGFSASLSAELAKEGSSAPSVPLTMGSSAGSAASASSGGPATGTNGGSSAGSNASARPATTTTTTTTAPTTTPPSATAATAQAATTPATTTPATTTPATTKTTAATTKTTTAATTASRVPVKPSPELAAIKMDLEPNWVRDVGEAGTISFVLNVPNSADTRVFSFHYGYDPAGAPDDRDAYMKWLADNKLLSVSLNRQRGAAWYLEGSDGNGAPAFRTLVMFGGKHLVCWGSLYKDAASNPLGDLRDKVVMTAKQICGTMAL